VDYQELQHLLWNILLLLVVVVVEVVTGVRLEQAAGLEDYYRESCWLLLVPQLM
jgi:hypothetical protein